MKQYLYWIGLCLLLLDVVACKPEMDDDLPPTDAVDTTAADTLLPYDCLRQDTTILDTTTYEDAPIWLPGAQQYGFAKGKKNGKDFEASVAAARFSYKGNIFLAVSLLTYSENGGARESLGVQGILLDGTERYTLLASRKVLDVADSIAQAVYGHLNDDVLGDNYTLDTLYDCNQLEINTLDTLNRIVKGKFTAAFLYENPYVRKEDPRNPDRCVFKDVYFECKIID